MQHPKLGELYVRCGGKRDFSVKDRISIIGTHQDISSTVRLEKERVAERRLAKRKRELEEQLDIIQTFGKVYTSSYYIDMKTGEFITLGNQIEEIGKLVGTSGNAKEKLDVMLKHIVKPDYEQEMRSFVDLTTLNERLKGKEWISHQFEGRFNGWAEGYFIAANRDYDGNCEHVIWAVKTIEEAKKLELEQQEKLIQATKKAQIANQAKTTFLFNMSHDIRTPMNAIIGFTDLMEKNAVDEVLFRNYLEKIRNSSEFLLSLINNVLEMARIESGNAILDETIWNVNEFNDSLYFLFERAMKEKNISFEREIKVTHNHVFCDEVKLREIYLNILSNAVKYTPDGGQVRMILEELDSDKDGYVKFKTTIADTGIGMSNDYLPHLYEEFSREQNFTESKIEGTGLGMPIVKKLVDLMDGTIEVDSELGKGTTFVITVYHRIANEEDLSAEIVDDYNDQILEGKRILLAEDNELNAEIAMAILEDVGLEVELAEDGIICVDKMAKATDDYYDLILMDIQMPNLNGYDATKRIRALKSNKKSQIPIIALTANAFEEDKRTALEAGMNDHLAKPIKIDDLVRSIKKVMKKI